MAHPLKTDSSDSHNAKLRRMTRDYGSASGPDNNRLAAVEALKDEGPEHHVGFGADYASATSRGDKPARRAVAANPIATYKKGGNVEARARGGRMQHKGKGSTHVNVIVAPHGAGAAPPAMPSPQLAALAGGPKPPMPMPPPGPPPGGPPPGAMGAPPMGPPPGAMGAPPMMRKRGGKVHSDEAQDKQLIKKELKDEGLIRKAKGGSIVGDEGKLKSTKFMTAGSVSGPGREEKNDHWAAHRNKKKQEV